MKRTLIPVMALILALAIFAGCSAGTLKPYESTRPEAEPADPYASDFGGSMEEFTAEDLQGNTVTQEVFSDYDLTVVEIWTTWCPTCVAIMPEIQALHTQLPGNVNFISICADGSKKTDRLKELMEGNGSDFTTLKDGDSLNEAVLKHIMAFPSFIYVDSSGKVVGDVQLGVPARQGEVAAAFLKIIDGKLELLGKSAE